MNINQKIEFIEIVKENPELYDKDNPHFHDYNKKEEIWNLIGEKFNIAEPKKKWATLRDKFVRLKRLRETTTLTSTNDSYAEEKWNLYKPLLFLNNFCRHRKRSTFDFKGHSNISNNTDFFEQTSGPKRMKSEKLKKTSCSSSFKSSAEDNFEFTVAAYNNDDEQSRYDESQEIENYCFAETISESNECLTTKGIKTEMLSENDSKQDLINQNHRNLKLNDETENFLFIKMIGKKLELLSNRDRNKIQIQILQLVNKELDKCDL